MLAAVSRNVVLDGRQAPALRMFDVVSGRARLRCGTAAGADGGPPEIYRALPYYLVYKIWGAFKERYYNNASPDPETWKFIDFVCIPKVSKPAEVEDFCYIGKLACFTKWYLRSLQPLVRPSLSPTGVATYGLLL